MDRAKEINKELEKDIEYYLNLDWTLKQGTDLDFNGDEYHYIEIQEFPSFAYCARTEEQALAGYKKQLRLTIRVMLEEGDELPEPGSGKDDIDWEALCP